MTGAEAGGIGASFAGPVLGYMGQRETNSTNYRIAQEQMRFQQASAREAMGFEDAQARAQMKFQERMSSTAMQRMKDDYKKAGLNPLLGLSNPASTPTGASGSGSSAQGASATMENALGVFATSAADAVKLKMQMDQNKEQLNLMKAQTANVDMDTLTKSKGVPEAEIKNDLYDLVRPIIKRIKEGTMVPSAKTIKNPELRREEDSFRKKFGFKP